MADTPHDIELDVTGLNCPLPLLKAKKTLNGMESSQVLKVIATDPGSERDFDVFSRQSGHALLAHWREEERFLYLLRKS